MAKKRDVGMAGSSSYGSEFYTTDKDGIVVPNARTMRLQGMDPKRMISDSQKQEQRVRGRAEVGLPMTDRDRARAKALKADVTSFGRFDPTGYDESDFQSNVANVDEKRRENTYDRSMAANEQIAKQKAQFAAQQKYGDNTFKSAAPITKAMMASYKKKGGK